MPDDLKRLLEESKKAHMTKAQAEEQRRSFAFGNTKIENDRITRETIDRQAEALRTNEPG